jgi:hypothetical protein
LRNGIVVGCSGTVAEMQYMRDLLSLWQIKEPPTHTDVHLQIRSIFNNWYQITGSTDLGHYVLIANGAAYEVCGRSVLVVNDFTAVGAGADIAKVALHCGKTAKEAIQIACKYSCYCSLPVKQFVIKIAKTPSNAPGVSQKLNATSR